MLIIWIICECAIIKYAKVSSANIRSYYMFFVVLGAIIFWTVSQCKKKIRIQSEKIHFKKMGSTDDWIWSDIRRIEYEKSRIFFNERIILHTPMRSNYIDKNTKDYFQAWVEIYDKILECSSETIIDQEFLKRLSQVSKK